MLLPPLDTVTLARFDCIAFGVQSTLSQIPTGAMPNVEEAFHY
jgi:hypothetical protein